MMKNSCVVWIEFFLVVYLLPSIFGYQNRIYVGGLFEEDSLVQKAFRYSLLTLHDGTHEDKDQSAQIIQPHFVEMIHNDSYDVSRTVCNLANSGVAAIFGPQNDITSRVVQSMCDTMGLPRITATWDSDHIRRNGFINMFPPWDAVSTVAYKITHLLILLTMCIAPLHVFLQLAMNYKWSTLAIIYEKTKHLARMNRLFKTYEPAVTVWQLTEGPNYRNILRDVRRSGDLNIVLDCSIEILPDVMKQAQQVGLMTHRHNYIIASLDLQTIDLEPYQHGETNITGLRLIDPDAPLVQETCNTEKFDWDLKDPSQLTVEAALVYDGVQLFGRALKRLNNTNITVGTMLCDNHESWALGPTLINIMKKIEFQGLTGHIGFDSNGYRRNFVLDLIGLAEDGVKKIGVWNSSSKVEPFPVVAFSDDPVNSDLRNRTLIVLLTLSEPYGMLAENAENKTGNARYEGYCVDIIRELSQRLGFNYTLVETTGDYGRKDPKTKEWNGVLRKIIDGHADLAIGDLTITAERQEVVDFTMPFMTLGISILFTKPLRSELSLFGFLLPFSKDVWLCLLAAYTFYSLLLFVVGRFCPVEWHNPKPCIKEPKVLENQFTDLTTVFYSNLGAILLQGSEIQPIGISTRMLTNFWWFFCLIMSATYTASLASCLLTEPKNVLISNVEDLANNQHGIEYGAKRGGSTFQFFNVSKIPTLQKMAKYMQKNADKVMLAKTEDGVRKVLKGNYAFLMESSTIDYEVRAKCDLDQVGGLLVDKGYGIAMKKDSKYRVALSAAVSELQETDFLWNLKELWWRQNRNGEGCVKDQPISAAKPLGTHNVGGVFLILVAGVALASVRAAWELIREVRSRSIRENVSFKEEMNKELSFVVKMSKNRKPVRQDQGILTPKDPRGDAAQSSSRNNEYVWKL